MTRLCFFRIITAALFVAWMTLIFLLSAETAAESGLTSGGFSRKLFFLLYPKFREFTAEQQAAFIESASFVVRKLAHFTIYGILGGFGFLAAVSYRRFSLFLRNTAAWIICVLYSVSDEIHQIFVAGRSGEVRDVLIDSCGALLGIAFCTAAVLLGKKSKQMVRRENCER